jgi:diguanylate cyclase (GGDEF)-like protein
MKNQGFILGTALRQIKLHFAVSDNPYAGGDIANAERLGAALWMLVLVLTVGLLPLSPPDEAVGDAGWLLAAVPIGFVLALVVALRSRHVVSSWDGLLAAAYLGVVAICALEWLAGGHGAPYQNLLFMPVMFVAAIHPPRRTAVFLGFVLLGLSIGFVYGGWSDQEAGAAMVRFVTWASLAVLIGVLMSGVRAQRLAMAQHEAEARDEARRDSLTGLRNRRAFDETAALETEQARRLGVPLSLILVDIEEFKQVNDRFGHLEGDRCLREVATSIGNELREPDLCFRWGGDEFAVLLTGTDGAGAQRLASRLGESVRRACQRPDGEPVVIRDGVAELRDDASPAELVEMADIALAASKRLTRTAPEAPRA